MTPEQMKFAPHGWYEVAARKKGGIAELADRVCSSLEVMMADERRGILSDITKVGFSTLGPPLRSGPRKGQRRYMRGLNSFVFVSRAEVEAVRVEYERASGLCAHCTNGQARAGWSQAQGTIWRECRRCAGTGIAAKENRSGPAGVLPGEVR